MKETSAVSVQEQKIDWTPTLFLSLTPILGLILFWVYLATEPFRWSLVVLAAIFYFLSAMSITAGYHRLYAHKSYDVPKWVEFLFLFFGAAAFQNSALKWATDHRVHHRFVDTDKDPYNAKRGFWYSHIGWMLMKQPHRDNSAYSRDLRSNPLVMWQHKNYLWLAIFAAFLLPAIIGHFLGSALGGIVIAGALRLTVNHHFTFFINSACHMWGRQPYSDKNTAKDNFVLALFTCGEGYHNFHHEFQTDYRNGIRWFDFDPTKWLILCLSNLGLAKNLKTVSPVHILRVRVEMEARRVAALPPSKTEALQQKFPHLKETLDNLNLQVIRALDLWESVRKESLVYKAQRTEAAKIKLKLLKQDLQLARLHVQSAYGAWKSYHHLVQSI